MVCLVIIIIIIRGGVSHGVRDAGVFDMPQVISGPKRLEIAPAQVASKAEEVPVQHLGVYGAIQRQVQPIEAREERAPKAAPARMWDLWVQARVQRKKQAAQARGDRAQRPETVPVCVGGMPRGVWAEIRPNTPHQRRAQGRKKIPVQ